MMTEGQAYPRVDEIAPYIPPEALLAVELAVKRWEVVQLRALLATQNEPDESGDS